MTNMELTEKEVEKFKDILQVIQCYMDPNTRDQLYNAADNLKVKEAQETNEDFQV